MIHLRGKNILLLFCFCIAAALLVVHLFKPVTNRVAPSKNTAVQPVTRPRITTAWISPVAQAAFVQTGHDSNTLTGTELAETEPATTNALTQDKTEIAEQEKYRLLHELRDWAAKDAEGALAAAMKLPEGDERTQALAAVCSGLAQTDPADAVKMARTLRLDEQPGAIMENLVQQWAATDLSAALNWANSQPAGSQRDGFTMRIAYVMSKTDPANAANLVINQMPPGSAQDEAVLTVLNQWANQNLVAATVWVKEFPEGRLQERAISALEGIQNHQQPGTVNSRASR